MSVQKEIVCNRKEDELITLFLVNEQLNTSESLLFSCLCWNEPGGNIGKNLSIGWWMILQPPMQDIYAYADFIKDKLNIKL